MYWYTFRGYIIVENPQKKTGE